MARIASHTTVLLRRGARALTTALLVGGAVMAGAGHAYADIVFGGRGAPVLLVEDRQLVLRLSKADKLLALRGDVRVPLAAVRGVEVLDDAFGAVVGIRAPGTGIPGVIKMGTYRGRGQQVFAVVRRVRGATGTPGLRVRLHGAQFTELIVSCPDPHALLDRLDLPPRPA